MADNIKNNVFEHITYEFYMYLNTFVLFKNISYIHLYLNENEIDHLIINNLIVESYQHYARNLIDFFSNSSKYKNDIIVHRIVRKEILDNTSFIYYEKNEISGHYKNENMRNIMKILNAGVSHLTTYRTKENLTRETREAMTDLYEGCDKKAIISIPHQIYVFLNLLEPDNLESIFETEINGINEYHDLKKEFADPEIQERIIDLKTKLIIKNMP